MGCTEKAAANPTQSAKYTLYVGLIDKNTYTQLIPTPEAEKKLEDIALKYVDGYTLFTGAGAFKDSHGVVIRETSLIMVFYFATQAQIEKIMDEVIIDFNQESVLLESQSVNSEFYPPQP
jgi:hypothetical protein